MNEPMTHAIASPEQIAAPTVASLPMLPIELLDACGNGYTAADLALVLAGRPCRDQACREAGQEC